MAQFDETKVINTLHTDKAKIGKRYWFADNISVLRTHVEQDSKNNIGELSSINEVDGTFGQCIIDGFISYYLIYPYEEPPKQRMTYRQLAEWLAKGNGQLRFKDDRVNSYVSTYIYYADANSDDLVSNIFIRTWDSEEWIEPTIDIYERDCKKEVEE